MEWLQTAALALAVVGALNWGLVALFKFDLVAFVAGGMPFGSVNGLSRLVYLLVAACGVIALTSVTRILDV
jgi:uncharacterized membrane protein YuzA (DUF378 family)